MRCTAPVPRLTTALNHPLLELEQRLHDHSSDIEAWLRQQWALTPAPFYCSVDLRNAGYKLAPVDTNLFPAGFNNLNPDFDALAIHALQTAVERTCPAAAGLVLIPESHTRNRFYHQHLARLHALLQRAGFKVRIGWLGDELAEPTPLVLEDGSSLLLEPMRREGNHLLVGDFSPCAIVLNNDLSGGVPEILKGLQQPILPPVQLGWDSRLKSSHFSHYQQVATEFSEHIDLDPWCISPLFRNCGQVNFMKGEGVDCLESNVAALLDAIADKYRRYQVSAEPFVIVKADAGTYGMGIMTVRKPEDVRSLNRKQRTNMASAKDGRSVTGAIVQEGVYTMETWGMQEASAEPVVYMVDQHVIGGFYRVHGGKSNQESLNAPGMEFQPLAFDSCCEMPQSGGDAGSLPNRFYGYGVVARLALVAAARERAAALASVERDVA